MPTRAAAVNSVQEPCAILRSLTEPRVRLAAMSDRVSSRIEQPVDLLKHEAEIVGSPMRT